MGQFDPASFLDQPMDGGFSTDYVPVPEGEYEATICADPEVREWQGRADPSKGGLALDLQWEIEDPVLRAEMQRDRVIVKQGIMLDMTPGGGLDRAKGRNVKLGRLLDAVGLNNGASINWRMLPGKRAKINVKHRVADDGQIFAEVNGTARL